MNESLSREAIARYFLHCPPPEQQTAAQQAHTRCVWRQLHALELKSVLAWRGTRRPLRRGDLGGYLHGLLTAAGEIIPMVLQSRRFGLAQNSRVPPQTVASTMGGTLCAFEPRLTALAVTELLAAMRPPSGVSPSVRRFGLAQNAGVPPQTVAQAAGGTLASCVGATLSPGRHALTLTIRGTVPNEQSNALAVAREVAWLHEGSLLVGDGAVSLSFRAGLPAAADFELPSAAEWRESPLSPLHFLEMDGENL